MIDRYRAADNRTIVLLVRQDAGGALPEPKDAHRRGLTGREGNSAQAR